MMRMGSWGGVGVLVVALCVPAQSLAAQGIEVSGRSSGTTLGRDDGRTEFFIRRTTEDIRVDGRIDDVGWVGADVIVLPYESRPGDNTPARVETKCMVTFDQDHLYLGCVAQDPRPDGIRAFITDRDNIHNHDRIVFTLDPFNDARRAFEFSISALGVQSDAVFNQQGSTQNGGGFGGGQRDDSWDAIWNSAGQVDADGYVVEAAIPFKSLRFPSAEGIQSWGFFVSRQWPRSEAVETRSMTFDRSNACELCQANILTGLKDIAPGRNLEFTPAVVAGRTDVRSAEGRTLRTGATTSELSLDAMWGITSNLTVNLTLNPDFSQVEADAPQLDVNNRFALFFPEKRSFFLEGADFFTTPIRALFTRTITSPDFGTKLTGKAGANAIGVMLARDELPTLTVPGPQGSRGLVLNDRVVTGVARARRDVGASNNVGAILLVREGEAYYNRVIGADAVVRPVGSLTARAQVLHSETRYSEAILAEVDQPQGRFGGTAARFELTHSTRNWGAQGHIEHLSAGFRADAGFVNQVDVNRANLSLRRTLWGDETWYTRIDLNGGYWHTETVARSLLDQGLWTSASIGGPAQSSLWVNPNLRREQFEGVTYSFEQIWFGGSVRPSGAIDVNVFGNVGGSVDYANGRLADQFQISPDVSVRIGAHFDVGLRYTYRRLSTEGRSIFDASVSQVRGVYNFTPRTFIRLIVQYRSTTRDPDLYRNEVDRFEESVLTQFLFSYKLNPQSVLFLGYGDDRQGWTERDDLEIPLTQTRRTFFAKAAFAWRP